MQSSRHNEQAEEIRKIKEGFRLLQDRLNALDRAHHVSGRRELKRDLQRLHDVRTSTEEKLRDVLRAADEELLRADGIRASEDSLRAHGIRISWERMSELFQEAVERLPRVLVRDDPRADLTLSEAAALEEGGFRLDAEPAGEDPLARTAAEFAALIETSIPTGEAAARLGVDPSRIRQRLTSQPPTLYGIRRGSGWVLPIFQFDDSRLLPGLGEVVAKLDPQLHPLSVYRWFTLPHPDLVLDELLDTSRTVSPRDWLRLGLPPGVVAGLAADL